MKMIFTFNSLLELTQTFNTEQKCIEHLEKLRWNDNVISPYDTNSQVYKCKGNRYKCKNTNKFFNVKTGTLFENSKIGLTKWFFAICLITSHKKGISSRQLAEDIRVTQKTAWFMLHRIRNCYNIDTDQLANEVEIDETFIGGKNKNRHWDKKIKNSQGRSFKDKIPVLGMLERNGNLIAKVVDDTKTKTLLPEIIENIMAGASVMTDEWISYRPLHKIYDHSYIKHNQGEYVNGRVHTNTIENFWSILKRGIVGVYHFATRKHLQKYVNEFVFRYNLKHYNQQDRFNYFFKNMQNRLRWKDLVANDI
ncbi:MAG: IS1595 family transposase [Treponema sp.]|nr:IS1595 family transposase [Treponema sp.]